MKEIITKEELLRKHFQEQKQKEEKCSHSRPDDAHCILVDKKPNRITDFEEGAQGLVNWCDSINRIVLDHEERMKKLEGVLSGLIPSKQKHPCEKCRYWVYFGINKVCNASIPCSPGKETPFMERELVPKDSNHEIIKNWIQRHGLPGTNGYLITLDQMQLLEGKHE